MSKWDWPGARWWRCDLHLHTPASHDFRDPQASASDWIEAAASAGLDVVAVTDHDNAGFIAEARAAAAGRLTVLAGVELTTMEGVHLLVLLGEVASEDAVKSLLGTCRVPHNQWGTGPARSALPLRDCVELCSAAPHNGLCVLAHADSDVSEANASTASFLRSSLDNRTRAEIIASPGLAAVEVCGDKPEEHEYLRGLLSGDAHRRSPGLALLTFSDAHRLDEIGRRSTWIKMTQPSHEGLRLALCDGDRSVMSGAVADPNHPPANTIESIEIEQAKYVGRSAALRIEFNPWLSTVIGGRGSGKSTVLNLLRATLERRGSTGNVAENLERFLKVGRRGEDGALTDATAVRVVYRKDGVRFRASWNTGQASSTLEQAGDAGWTVAEGSVSTRLPVQVLGQGEIHETARKPRALLGIVDRSPAVGVADWRRRFDDEVAGFLALRAQARQAETASANETDTRGELQDVTRSLEVFEAAEHRDTLRLYEQRRQQARELDRFVASGKEAADTLRRTVSVLSAPGLSPDALDATVPDEALVIGAVDAVRVKIGTSLQAATRSADEIDQAVDGLSHELARSAWRMGVEHADGAYAQLVASLKQAGVDDPQKYGNLIERRQSLQDLLARYDDQRAEAAALHDQANASLARIATLRAELSESRRSFLEALLASNPLVRVAVEPLADVQDAAGALREILGVEVSFDQDIQALARIVQDDSGTMSERLARMKARVRAIVTGDTDAPVTDARFRSRLQGINAENLDRLDAWFPEDRLVPSYSRGDGQFRPLSQGSAGQQNAAILAFLLAHGDEPIVIDQPESDLDNRLITELVVAQLRQIKPLRQVILVTHNPNIVVNGDAELVIALDIPHGEVQFDAVGGLQEHGVRAVICDVMEGGRDAFEARYSRIGERSSGQRQ